MTRVVGAASRTTAASGAIPSRRSGSERAAPGVVTPEASLLHAGLLQGPGPGLTTSPSPHAGRQPLRHLRDDVVEGPAHGACQRRGIAVGDPDPGAERALEVSAACTGPSTSWNATTSTYSAAARGSSVSPSPGVSLSFVTSARST